MSQVNLITESLFDKVAEDASESPRRRMNYNFHSGPEDNPHRFLNVLLNGTYIRPHRHLSPPKSETFLVLEGAADVIVFDDAGAITARHHLGTDLPEGKVWGVDLTPGVWHTILARSERVICFEVKPGPWDPASDKDFAPWAPAEKDPAAAGYLEKLIAD
ncbi:MAG: WbuC family cupin fold metalloprotein [Acidobacteriia bacterium]|nr:WbuC family cupin fold metalloprotein [Terriglobia bacterium]